MQKKKGLALVLSFALVACLAVAGTLAWLTDTTDAVENTFTVGEGINIGLDEADTDEYGVEIKDAARTDANEYKLIPGHTYIKDPTVHVEAGSEPCYVFVKVVNDLGELESADQKTIAEQMADYGWKAVTGVQGSENIYYLAASSTDAAARVVDVLNADKNLDLVVFDQFVIADEAELPTAEEAENIAVTIKACAVQSLSITFEEACAEAAAELNA